MHVTLMRVPADGRKQGGTTDYELRPYAGRSFCFLRESTKPCEGKSTGLSRMLAYNHMEGEDYEREIAGNQRRSNETDPAV